MVYDHKNWLNYFLVWKGRLSGSTFWDTNLNFRLFLEHIKVFVECFLWDTMLNIVFSFATAQINYHFRGNYAKWLIARVLGDVVWDLKKLNSFLGHFLESRANCACDIGCVKEMKARSCCTLCFVLKSLKVDVFVEPSWFFNICCILW